jgi:hypothetical protein
LKEWMQFAYRFAEHINYFDTLDDKRSSGNWTEFFKNEDELAGFLESVDKSSDVTPHLALYICFIKLIEFTRGHFNKLTKKHLDFYYNKILKIDKLVATPDKVHVIFELAKKSVDTKIAQNTELDGGKDANGKKRIYKTTEELVANKINLTQVKSVYNDLNKNKIKAAEAANSYDGIGGDFPDDDVKWWPFGYYCDENYPELPDAKLGFALSSNIFELSEGERNIQITIEFTDALSNFSANQLQENLEVYCSGEKGWLGPYELKTTIPGTSSTRTGTNLNSTFVTSLNSNNKFLKLAFQIDKDEKAVVNYNPDILGEYFNSEFPVCRFLFKTENGYTLYKKLIEKKIKEISVDIDVKGIMNLSIENDIGVLNGKKPFYPFGTQPIKGSNFYIDHSELFKKNWGKIDTILHWKNTPEKSTTGDDAFIDLYLAYTKAYLTKTSLNGFTFNTSSNELIVTGNDYFKAQAELMNNSATSEKVLIIKPNFKKRLQTLRDRSKKRYVNTQYSPINEELSPKNITLFSEEGTGFIANISFSKDYSSNDIVGPIKLSLNQSFLHELYSRIYALAYGNNKSGALIPNEPYTPLVESISLNYTAQTKSILGSTEDEYLENDLKLFHEHPFGQSEEHPYLKSKLDFIDSEDLGTYLTPTYCKGGELYLGFENASNLQQVSLLVQVLEGSENPEAESFTGKQKVEWYVLCENYWKSLDSNYMVANETDNFLKSGIVKFSIPKDATTTNTCLESGLIWVKAKLYKNYDAVSKAISIHTQAVLAQFSDNGNELSHLNNGLAAKSISKLIQRVATVKSISQPFNSFDGLPQESDMAYYRRISERLRHKNRAISVWDYEHIILQQFPDIHKVKCLNHSTESSFLSPGNVLVIVIPDIVNKNVFDIYQPRVSKATLSAVQDHINQLNTLHVKAKVINPVYEEVTIELKAKFHSGYDENYYLKVLNDDITRFLSPWAFERTASIEFGVTLQRSVLINYIEKLEYVDYLEGVKLKKADETSTTSLAPSKPTAILVSAKQHELSCGIENCTETTEPQEKCQ